MIISAINPGWCRTDMAGDRAPLTAAQGTDTQRHNCVECPKGYARCVVPGTHTYTHLVCGCGANIGAEPAIQAAFLPAGTPSGRFYDRFNAIDW